MSAAYRCDKCGKKGGFFDGGQWYPPKDWPPGFPLDNWEIHGCCWEHLNAVLEEKGYQSPPTSGWKLDTPPKPSPRPQQRGDQDADSRAPRGDPVPGPNDSGVWPSPPPT